MELLLFVDDKILFLKIPRGTTDNLLKTIGIYWLYLIHLLPPKRN